MTVGVVPFRLTSFSSDNCCFINLVIGSNTDWYLILELMLLSNVVEQFSTVTLCSVGQKTYCGFLFHILTVLHSEWPKLHRVLALLSAIGLKKILLFYFIQSENNF